MTAKKLDTCLRSIENVVAAMDFTSQKPILTFSVPNNNPGAECMTLRLAEVLASHQELKRLVIALEETSFYDIHIANYLSTCLQLAQFHPAVYDALAKYAGIVWRESQSRKFRAEDTALSKAGNAYLRYYILEATSHIKNNCIEINKFYKKKYAAVKTHQLKRALALTSRKVIRLIFGLLAKHQLYSGKRIELK